MFSPEDVNTFPTAAENKYKLLVSDCMRLLHTSQSQSGHVLTHTNNCAVNQSSASKDTHTGSSSDSAEKIKNTHTHTQNTYRVLSVFFRVHAVRVQEGSRDICAYLNSGCLGGGGGSPSWLCGGFLVTCL